MKKYLTMAGVFFSIFLISLFVASKVMNKGQTDLTRVMPKASLPVVYLNLNDEYINPLHGYTTVMEGNYLRESITPLQGNREIRFRVDLYDAVIAGMGYEVRSMDMNRLIEDSPVSESYMEDDYMYGTIALKDLIDEDTEYMLVIKLTTSSGEIIRYYARIINRAELGIGEKIAFVRDFSERTLDKEAALELKQYMESNSKGDNSSYAYVNINSSFNQLTWGDLEPRVLTGKSLQILEIDGISASIMLKYQVEVAGEVHNVSEYFRIRKGDKRMHLMEYERIMNQVFDEEKNVVVNGKILHGILNEKPQMIESETGSRLCFVQQSQLYAYTPETGVLSKVFAFCDKENDDARTKYLAHNIKPLSIDESGNIYFLVYGYMNRGIHEGEVGAVLYYYDYAFSTIEEQFFLPYSKSYQILEQEIDSLCYINARDDFFVLMNGSIYSIEAKNHYVHSIQGNISDERFVSSLDRSVIAWQPGETLTEYNEIKLLALNWTDPLSISAPNNCIVLPLGFIDRDLVYGMAQISDFTTDETGRTVTPMYSVRIQDISGRILKEYSYPNIYVTDVEITDNQILMNRMTKDMETGEFIPLNQDQIMNNEVTSNMKNKYTGVVTEDYETIYQTVLRKEPSTKNPKLVNPKEVVFDLSREILLEDNDSLKRYYVYAKNDIDRICIDAADAVVSAYNDAGVVVNANQKYIWESENRKSSYQISKAQVPAAQNDTYIIDNSVENSESDEGEEEIFGGDEVYATGQKTQRIYGLCLDVMLQCQDVYKNTVKLAGESSVREILEDNLPNMDVLDLTGCDLSAVLYYVSRGNPVMVLCPNKEAVVIVGYDSKNTILYNPMDGTIAKRGMYDSRAWFESNGNKYITYIEK